MTYIPERIQSDIKYWEDRVEKMLHVCEVVPLGIIEEMFPEGHWAVLLDGKIEYTLPMDFQLIKMVRTAMEHFGYEKSWDHQIIWHNSGNAGHFLHYRPEGTYSSEFSIAFRTGEAGATCVLNKVGDEMKPIYEVICAEGAKEGVFDE